MWGQFNFCSICVLADSCVSYFWLQWSHERLLKKSINLKTTQKSFPWSSAKFALAEFSVEVKFKLNFCSEISFFQDVCNMSFISVWMCRSFTTLDLPESPFSLLYSQKLKEKKLQAKKNKLEQKKQEKGQWNLVYFSQDLVLFPYWSLEGFVPPPIPSILNTWIKAWA